MSVLSFSRVSRPSARRAALRSGAAAVDFAGPLTPAQTSFDFLAGAFRIDERARVRGMLLLGSSISAFILAASAGFLLFSWNSQLTAELSRTGQAVSRLSIELGELSNTGGVAEQDLKVRLELLGSHLRQAERTHVDLLVAANDLRSALPAGSQLASIDVARADTGVQTLSAQITLDSFNRLTELSAGVERIWYLRDTSITWSSGANQVSVSLRAVIDSDLSSGRVAELFEQLGAGGS
jgi:hypothetical protein